jgi:toxin-antitoxin system PIN domain toxin
MSGDTVRDGVRVADVNVLIYAHRAESPDHPAYAAWVTALVDADEPFGFSELAASGFVRIVTNVRVFKQPTPLGVALRFIEEFYGRPTCVRLRPGPDHWAIFSRLCAATAASGKLVADAYHAALAIEHGCELATTDSDFARFPGLRSRHPLRA